MMGGNFFPMGWSALLLLLLCGCSSIRNAHTQKSAMMSEYLGGDNAAVVARVDDKLAFTHGSGDELMWQLESGSIKFTTGDYAGSIRSLNRAEFLIAEQDNKADINLRDGTFEVGMALTNLNALPYRGYCRDRIMIPIYRALDYLGSPTQDGIRPETGFLIELAKMRHAQQDIEFKYKQFFAEQQAIAARAREQYASETAGVGDGAAELERIAADPRNAELVGELDRSDPKWREKARDGNHAYRDLLNPFSLFLSGFGYARANDWENALVDFQKLYESQPENPVAQTYYRTILGMRGRPVPKELEKVAPLAAPFHTGTVLVIFANGRSAALKQIAIYFPIMVAWPVCEYYPAPYDRLQVRVGSAEFSTRLLADMDKLLTAEYMQRLTAMIVRISISTLVKEAASATAVTFAFQSNTFAGIAVLLGTMAYKYTFNTADTRSWEMLPKEFQIVQFPMPPERTLELSVAGGDWKQRVQLPSGSASAIVWVQTPDRGNFHCKVFAMPDK